MNSETMKAKQRATKIQATTPYDRTVRESPAPYEALPANYAQVLSDIKGRIQAARGKAALAVNQELIRLYWDIGAVIVGQQRKEGWGKAIVERLAADIQREFPGVSGFSPQNIWFMRAFYLAWTEDVIILQQPVRELKGEILSQPATELENQVLSQLVRELDGRNLPSAVLDLPWGHNINLVTRLKDPLQRLWYARQTVEHGWSRAVLVHQIESDLYGRQGKALTNFKATLPAPQSELAQQLVKDPYNFEFLGLGPELAERQLELGLIARLKDFLVELGKGFAFVGQQYHLEVGGEDFYLDLLFYHLHLRCYVVIDLKVEPFKPEFAGKMNFYLAAVDDLLRHPADRPTIGLILCKDRNRVVVEYALRDTKKPMGVTTYRTLPRQLHGELPTTKQIVSELGKAQLKKDNT